MHKKNSYPGNYSLMSSPHMSSCNCTNTASTSLSGSRGANAAAKTVVTICISELAACMQRFCRQDLHKKFHSSFSYGLLLFCSIKPSLKFQIPTKSMRRHEPYVWWTIYSAVNYFVSPDPRPVLGPGAANHIWTTTLRMRKSLFPNYLPISFIGFFKFMKNPTDRLSESKPLESHIFTLVHWSWQCDGYRLTQALQETTSYAQKCASNSMKYKNVKDMFRSFTTCGITTSKRTGRELYIRNHWYMEIRK